MRASARNPRREPVRDTLRHLGQFGEGNALDSFLSLNLKRNVVGELPGRFLESLVEGGHGSEEILQGRTSEANPVLQRNTALAEAESGGRGGHLTERCENHRGPG